MSYTGLVDSMASQGWKGEPIDVVRMPDGGLTTLDNTRVMAAREAGIDVQAVVRDFDEKFVTDAQKVRQLSLTENDRVPNSYGEAILLRTQKEAQNMKPYEGWSQRNPYGQIYDIGVRNPDGTWLTGPQ